MKVYVRRAPRGPVYFGYKYIITWGKGNAHVGIHDDGTISVARHSGTVSPSHYREIYSTP